MKKAYGKANLPKSGFRFFFAVAAAFFFMERRSLSGNRRITQKESGLR